MRHGPKIWMLAAVTFTLLLLGGDARAACDPGSDLVISEFMAQNAGSFLDEDGDPSDWIEIYNPCTPNVDLDGWYLTDDAANLTKWRFPGVHLDRGEFLIVFASDKNRAVAGSPLHANFKLDVDGEFLALVKPDGTTVAHSYAPLYPPQYPDVSYGLPQASSTPIAAGAAATWRVPTVGDAALGEGWTAVNFDDTTWSSGPTGLGFAAAGSGSFDVTYYKSTVQVPNLETAEAVIADPALHTIVATARPSVINYLNTGASAHFAADAPFPGTQINVNVDDFVVLVTGSILIPSAGPWTFGVNSDDGFGLELSRQPHVFESSFPNPRGPADTLATFDVQDPGVYAVRLVFYERGGGSELELFAAQGTLASFSSAFHLVGDTAAGGLAVAGLGALIGTDVGAAMQGVNTSLWSRVGFPIADPGQTSLLTLRMAYEDGFVAWLNGTEVARRNAPASTQWNSAAATDRPLLDAGVFEQIDLTDTVGLLQPGTNVLAVQGLNETAADPAFLVLPELSVAEETLPAARAYFTPATPRGYNAAGYPGVSATPVFSRGNATFIDPFTLTITTDAPAGVIRYTLDGSDPTDTHGTTVTGPIDVTTSARVRARVLEPGLAPGPVVTRLYVHLGADVAGFTSNLPIVVLDTFGGGLNETWLTETLASIIPVQGTRASITGAAEFTGFAGIRIRGSSSTQFPKKQFAFEAWDQYRDDLDVPLLGMPSQSDWILYAPYTDKSLMRDVLAYKWSNDIGRYAVRTRFVEVFLRTTAGPLSSGDYAGVYVLEEKIKRDPNRVNITKLLSTDGAPPEVTGGYIIKKDRLDPGDAGFLTTSGQRLAYVEPKEEEITTTQAGYLGGFLNEMESVLYGPGFLDPVTGYGAYLDADSFIDHHILVEMTKNIDGFRLSTFMFKDRGAKLNMGPIWDYNLTLGNANYLDGWLPTGWYNDLLGDGDYPWYRRIFQDPEFRMRYADRWYALRRDAFSTARLMGDIDADAALLSESQVRNYVRWPILGIYVWPNWYIGATYQDEIVWMKQWLTDRLAWIDSQFPAPPAFNHAPGQVPTGFNLTITGTGVIRYTLDGSDPRLPGGGVSPGAATYAAPLVITQLSHVRARALDGGVWSAINDATFAPVPPVYLNEVLPVNVTVRVDEHGDYDPWIEIYNPFPGTAGLGGLTLTDDPAVPGKWPIPADTDLCGGNRVVIWADAETAQGPLHASFRLAATGGSIWLFDATGIALDTLSYPALASNVSYGRDPDGSANLSQFIYPTPGEANRHLTTRILVNEYNGVATNRLLAGTGTDVYWGRILGNGGDWFELVVVEDHLDLRGFRVVVNDNSGAIISTLTFTGASLLSDLRSGTIITVAADLASDVSYDPQGGDWWINLQAGAAGDGLYISSTPFSVSQQNTQIAILDPAGRVVYGPAGEGINPASGVGNDEVLKLEDNPGPSTTAFSGYHDGTTSSFGAPNLWSGGAGVQDFGALRSPVLAACATDAACDDGDPCTDDACVGARCANTPNTAPCDDGDPCTGGDACQNRVCVGGQAVAGCCASDCDCDDGNACTQGDACVGGTCVTGAPVVCDDGDACTADACNPADGACLFTASGLCGVDGVVYYYRDDGGAGSEPSAKVVPNVGIDRTQDAIADATTDSGGAYAFGALFGDLTVTTVAKFGTPRASDHNGAISSFDAAVIARAAALLVTLSPNQRLAADVTGDGTVSSFDAAHVGRFAALLEDHFGAAVTRGSDWLFLRCDAYVFPGDPGCGPAAHLFTPIAQAETGKNFHAILYGDVTGNWRPAAGLTTEAADAAAGVAATSAEERAAIVADRSLAERLRRGGAATAKRPVTTGRAASGQAVIGLNGWTAPLRAGERRRLTINLTNADGILGLDLALRYDPSRLAIVAVEAAGIGAGYSVTHGEQGGVCRIAAFGVLPLSGSGAALTVTVEALKSAGAQAPIDVGGLANEGAIPLVTRKR